MPLSYTFREITPKPRTNVHQTPPLKRPKFQLFLSFLLSVTTNYHNIIHSCPQQQHTSEQHSKQPKHARAVHSCVRAIIHCSFSLEQHCTQHIQQHWPNILLQQLEAAFTNISAASGSLMGSDPGRISSIVAERFPNPTQRFLIMVVFCSLGFRSRFFFKPCSYIENINIQHEPIIGRKKIKIVPFRNHLNRWICLHLNLEGSCAYIQKECQFEC